MTDEGEGRFTPVSDLDFNFLTTNPSWGVEVPDELDEKLVRKLKHLKYIDPETGDVVIPFEKLKSQLSFYNRDFRLGNLNALEVEYCATYTDIAGDCLAFKFPKSFSVSLQRVATRLELSQSKSGFLRRRSNTITSENYSQHLEPQKRGMFGGKQKPKEGQY